MDWNLNPGSCPAWATSGTNLKWLACFRAGITESWVLRERETELECFLGGWGCARKGRFWGGVRKEGYESRFGE